MLGDQRTSRPDSVLSSPSTASPRNATISASRITFCVTGFSLLHVPSKLRAARMIPCTACLSRVESLLLLLKMVMRDTPFSSTSTWIWARSPSYLVSAHTRSEPERKSMSACSQPRAFSDFGICYEYIKVGTSRTVRIMGDVRQQAFQV